MAGDDDERDYYGELFASLRNKNEDVWFDTVGNIDLDEGVPILMWMVDQPQCTRPLAASIFWASAPDFYAAEMLQGQTFDEDIDESYALILRILKNWRAGLYAKGHIAFEGPGSGYRDLLARHPGSPDPLDVPDSLFVSFPGRMPRVPVALTPDANGDLWDIYTGLAMPYGPRPRSSGWSPPKEPYRTAYETDRISAAARKTNASPAQTTPFLRTVGLILIFGCIAIAAALVAHRLRLGTW